VTAVSREGEAARAAYTIDRLRDPAAVRIWSCYATVGDHLPDALRRDRAATSAGRMERLAFRAWSAAWSRPWLYRLTTRAARRMNIRGQAPFMHVPVLGRWVRTRDLRGRR